MKAILERLYNGIVKENPTFVLMLGMCPTLAVTTSAKNGLGMGIATMAVLIMSNLLISLLRKVIPSGVRVPVYIIIIASFVTIVEMLMHAYVTPLYESLGIFIPLIVVNCIILGRAEQYASKNGPLLSIFDGIGIGLGFTVGLTVIGIVRELLGAGTIFGLKVTPESFEPVSIFVMAPGAFFVLALLCALQNKLKLKGANRHVKGKGGCSGNCADCNAKEGGCK
ncbi:MAG: electron transport complex subunit E [Eubacterium sp.]|nr:electron transport complex subunit E [Eubacterium sp.]MDE6155602.1 electron transport complex subunit E [Eubacterium sp.]MDE6767913.1 electron transport complex subunit E [Eubacterium sp.]